MYRVLIFGMTEVLGGTESFILNYCRCMDKKQFQFDYLCNTHKAVACEEELLAMGGEVYHICARHENYKRYRKELTGFFETHAYKYDAIWVNVCSLANVDYLIRAKQYGIGRRIIHSHSQSMGKSVREILHKYYRKRIGKIATDFWACSKEAAEYFYDPNLNSKVQIVPNAIEVERYVFDLKKRDEYRSRLAWQNCYIIGNVGRLHSQKNQMFLLDVFAEIILKEKDARLLFVGEGEEEQPLRDKAKKLGVSDFVFFAGSQRDIQGWLSAMDIFLFPSKLEGFGIAALEAQANGLPVVASNRVIPKELKINENFVFFDLDRSANEWAKQILSGQHDRQRLPMDKVKKNFALSKYNIKDAAIMLQQLFIDEE